jgi:hypothetical protein
MPEDLCVDVSHIRPRVIGCQGNKIGAFEDMSYIWLLERVGLHAAFQLGAQTFQAAAGTAYS